MGLVQAHALGRNRRFFVETESTAGTFVKATSAGAAKLKVTSMDKQIERKDREDSRPTRSLLERITGKGTISWSAEGYLIPSGTAGTPPDIHELLYGILGTYANVPATSDTYSPSETQVIRTVSLTHHYNDVAMESAAGCWVNAATITSSGGDEPTIAFEGGAMSMAFTGNTTLDAATPGGGATFQVQPGGTRSISVNSVVQVGTDDNSSAGFQVDAVNHTTYIHTATGDTITAQADDSDVLPFSPAETTAGSPINGITGSLTLDGTEYPITAFDVTISNNIKPLDDEAYQQFPDDIIPGFRQVTGTIGIRARKDLVIELGKREAFGTRAIVVVLGSGAGTTCTISLDQVEIGFAAAEFPEVDEGTISLPYTALGTGAGNNEIDIAFT